MKIIPRKGYRWVQQLLAVRTALTVQPNALSAQKNSQSTSILLQDIQKIKITKGWWFSRLHIHCLNKQKYVFKGYAYAQLVEFHQQCVQNLIHSVADNERWQWFYQQMQNHKSALHYYSSQEWQGVAQLKLLADEFNKLGVKDSDFTLLMHREIYVYANQLSQQSISEAGRIVHNQQVVQNLLQQNAAFFAKVNQNPLTVAQQTACVTNNDHTLVVAGAGSGKTAVIMAKAAYLLYRKLAQPEQILLLAFGQKAAEEMRDRIRQRLPKVADRIQVKTFHSFGLFLLKQKYGQQLSSNQQSISTQQVQSLHQQLLASDSEYQTSFATLSQTYNFNDRTFCQLVVRCLPVLKENGLPEKTEPNLAKVLTQLTEVLAQTSSANSIDFSDMITTSEQLLAAGEITHDYKYIIVDEYQDISAGRVKLLQTLIATGQNTRLFAVGDDWQSIYRFNGSDLRCFTDFNAYFSPSERINLDTSFRFNNKIAAVSSEFIQQNPHQLKKQVQCLQKINEPAVHLFSVQDYLPETAQILEHINREASHLNRQISVLLIGRNAAEKTPGLASFNLHQQSYSHLSVEYVTAHSSKGLEADICIILAVDEGVFPSKRQTHPLLEAVLAPQEDYPNAEERRLFYVALTRARHQVYVLYQQGKGSKFIDELKTYPADLINQ